MGRKEGAVRNGGAALWGEGRVWWAHAEWVLFDPRCHWVSLGSLGGRVWLRARG